MEFSPDGLSKVGPDADLHVVRYSLGERLTFLLFFVSGFPALIYQIAWQRSLFRIFGVNAESVTMVVTVFMLGLGIGNLAGGFVSRFSRIPMLLIFGFIELGVGAFGLISLPAFDWLGNEVLGAPLPATAAAVLAMLLVPTVLMGMTLPLLIAHFAPRLGSAGASAGSLYYVNTLGAGVSCFLVAVGLFPLLGMSETILFGAILNGLAGFAAVLAYGVSRDGRDLTIGVALQAAPNSNVLERLMPVGLRPALLLSALEGFISLSYEIFLFRILAYATGSLAPVFPIVLGMYLIGLASGARTAGAVSKAGSEERLVAYMVRALVIAVVVGFLLLPVLTAAGDVFRQGYWVSVFHAQAPGLVSLLVVAIVGLMFAFLLARQWGIVLPALIGLSVPADRRAGTCSGIILLSNIVGAACGSLLTGFVLTDWLRLADLASFLTVAGIGYLVVLAALCRYRWSGRTWLVPGAVVATILMVVPVAQRWLVPRPFDSLLTMQADARPVIEVLENRHGAIAVDADETVFGNGMYDGHFNTDLVHDNNMVVRPFALSLFHPAPRNVLMIGLSSGSWAQVIANNPAVDHLTIVEINPGYLSLIRERSSVLSILDNPKVTIVVDDGRRWLNLHPGRQFDAVVSNTTFHLRSNISNLLSIEFQRLIRAHLMPGGIFYYNTTGSRRAQLTGCRSFRYGWRFLNFMVVSDTPIVPDFGRWNITLVNTRIDGRSVVDLARPDDAARLHMLLRIRDDPHAWDGVYGPVNGPPVLESCDQIRDQASSLRPITDDNMGSEFRLGG